VLSEQTNYALRVSGYSGNAGDGLGDPIYNNNCAVYYRGGFWYKACANGRVNGVRGVHGEFSWYGLPGIGLLQSSRMWLTCR